MKRYNIIFTKNSKILLSSEIYENWKEIQNMYENYMTSLDFETIDEIIEYFMAEYNFSQKKSKELIEPIIKSINTTIELDF